MSKQQSHIVCRPLAAAIATALVGLAWATAARAQQAPQVPPAPAQSDSLQASASLPSLTVTAGKREQRLDSINGSVVALDQQQVDDAQVRSTQDLARVLPGVQISGSGSLLYPIISLRGITSAQDFYSPALTLYVDGVPQIPVFFNQSLVDVERVELIKGPQGTLYGKSAEGGVINVITRHPDNEVHVRVKTGWSSRDGNLLGGALSLPLVKDMLYASVVLRHNTDAGDLRNGATGASHQGGVRSETGLVKLLLAPTGERWQAGLSVGRDCARASQDAYVPFNDIARRTAYVQANMPTSLSDFYQRRCGSSQSLDAAYDLGQWKLSALAAWQQAEINRAYPIGPYYTQQPEDWRQDMQELRLASQGGKRAWDGVFGLYRQATGQNRHYINDLPTYGLNALDTRSHNESESVAAYGDATWHATERLDLSAGLRLTQDRARTVFNGTALSFSNFAQVPFSGASSTAGNSLLGKISAGLQLDSVWRLYTNAAQGYKPGGYNLAPSSLADAQPFSRERATSYEAGARFRKANLRGSIAAYRIDVRDAQLYQGDSVGYQSLRNVGDTRSSGIEVDLAWSMTPQWTLNASGFLNRARFTRYVSSSACNACENNQVPFAPRHGATLGVQGELPSSSGMWRPQINVRYVGAQYFDTANTLRQSAYTVFDAALAWQVRRDTELSVYAHNLTDRAYRTYAFSSSALGSFAQVATGRTLGLTLSYSY